MKPGANFHTNAALLIVTAAEKSGLLQEIAQALHYADKTPGMDCPICELLERLIEEFDEHSGLPGLTLESFYGEGLVCEASEEEITPWLGISPSEPRV